MSDTHFDGYLAPLPRAVYPGEGSSRLGLEPSQFFQ